jgi:hypothetical protein
VARGMETARFRIEEKSALVAATDHYLAARLQAMSAEFMARALGR